MRKHKHNNKYLIAMLLFVCANFAFAQSDNKLPVQLQNVGIEQRLNSKIPLDAEFVNENGKTVPLKSYFAKQRPVILSLVYYECPMLCTEVLNGLLKSLKFMKLSAGKDFDVLTVSFDPRETPELARAKKDAYTDSYKREGAAAGWHFLTGSEASIRRLTEAAGFRYNFDESTGQFAHGAAIMVVTPDGTLAQYFYGVEYSARDLRLALVEASEGKIGTIVDQVLLYCFHYDPKTGKYSAVAINMIRVGGVITVLVLGTFIIANRRREKRQAGASSAE